jgi:Mg-chelatase subunit ChlD
MRGPLSLLLALAACGSPAPAAPPAEPVANTSAAAPADTSSLAVVVVIDRSGSMMGPKLEGTRDGVRLAAAALPADAELGVIAFDTAPIVVVPLTRASEADAIAAGMATLEPGGGTQFLPALVSTRDLLASSGAARKHVVFVSDGLAAYDGVVEAARALRDAGATVSTIAIPDADEQLLGMIAEAGAGRAHVLGDVSRLPAAIEAEVREVIAP